MREQRRPIVVWVSFVAILVAINLPPSCSNIAKSVSRETVAPFQNLFSELGTRVKDGWSALFGTRNETSQKEDLLQQIGVLNERLKRVESLGTENERLRSSLGFLKRFERKLVFCEVIGRGDAAGWWETIRLNKGSKEGLTTDLAVITSEGLVGKTISVSRHACEVMLITDRNCNVAAEVRRTGAFGIIQGRSDAVTVDSVLAMRMPVHPCVMEYVSRDEKVIKGDDVVSSGLGGIYPKGLHVGLVDSVRTHDSGLYQSVQVMPSARLEKLRHAFVVLSEGKVAETAPGDHE